MMRLLFGSGSFTGIACLIACLVTGGLVNGCRPAPQAGAEAGTEAGTGVPSVFYVDAGKGNDAGAGTLEEPFRTLDKALEVVAARAARGIRSDKIYLRGGRYKKISDKTLYRLELKGTPDNYAELSAMPCDPNTPGCVERKSGKWYEKVVFDDAWEISTSWERVAGTGHLWKTNPGYTRLEWTHQNLWPWTITEKGFPITDQDATPETTLFTVAPYMVLQDGEPLLWADYVDSLTGPGMRTYDHETGELYVWPNGNKDPNTCRWESWYGGPEDYEPGTLYLDGEGRALFDGNLEFAAIRGFEFYVFNKIFELHRRKYESESQRVIQRHVLMEDNLFRYGWMHILLDGNTVNQPQKDILLPRYHDRSHWTMRYNVFYRPSRECFQLHGDNHVFEYNDIIERLGPWAGPAACVSAVNTRNTRNARIRYNHFFRQGNSKWTRGSVLMIEVGSGGKPDNRKDGHTDGDGDYIYGGQTYEYNLFEDIRGPVMVLGKGGGIRMRDITVRNNIFKNVRGGAAIRLSSPHQHLVIENNIFYNQESAISLPGADYMASYQALPSSISIRNNIFAGNRQHIDPALLKPHANSNLYIGHNLFYGNEQPPLGEDAVTGDPEFRSPDDRDFRPRSSSEGENGGGKGGEYQYFGPYPPDGSFRPGTDWWNADLYSEDPEDPEAKDQR